MSAYVCELCDEEGREFTVPVDEIGAAVMQEHLKSEHNVIALAFRPCLECGAQVACMLGRPGPSHCGEHR